MVNDPQELILEHLRAIRADQGAMSRKLDTIQTDLLTVRKDINRLSGELLRFEKSMAAMGLQIDRINVRLGLNEAQQ